jgi:glucose/arabinose dehydrogenase
MFPRLLWQKPLHSDAIFGLAFSRTGRALASCGADGTIRLTQPEAPGRVFKHPQLVTFHDLAMSAAEDLLVAAGASDELAWLWDGATGRVIGQLNSHEGEVLCVAFSPTGDRLVWGAADGSACVWHLQQNQLLAVLPHRLAVRAMAFSPSGQFVATASDDGRLCLWDGLHGRLLATPVREEHGVTSVAFSQDGAWLAGGLERGHVLLIEMRSGRVVAQLEGHTHPVLRVVFSPDSRLLVTSGEDALLAFWSPERGKMLAAPLKQSAPAAALAFAAGQPSGSYQLATGNEEGQVALWTMQMN